MEENKKIKFEIYDGSTWVDVSGMVTEITWSGDYQQCARSLKTGIVSKESDPDVPVVRCEIGDHVRFSYDGTLLFFGSIFHRGKVTGRSVIELTCWDRGIYLKRSTGTYMVRGMDPATLVKRICGDFNIPVGNIAAPSGKFDRKFIAQNLWKIILTAYTLAGDEKKYVARFQGEKLDIMEKKAGENSVFLKGDHNLMEAHTEESAENVVTVAQIVNREGQVVQEKKDDARMKKFGRMQQQILESDDAVKQLEKMVADGDVEQTITVDNMGNIRCITGNTVVVQEPYTKVMGLFWIDTDTHTWKNGQYYNKLTLNFKNIMEEMEIGESYDVSEATAGAGAAGGAGSAPSGTAGKYGGSWNGSMTWPVPGNTRVSSGFGPRKAPAAGASTYHNGIDIPAASGTGIVAAAAGKVIQVGSSNARGRFIKVDHGSGMVTLYQHCSTIIASAGQTVKAGQVIAKVGSTGISTGPHLHFETQLNGVPKNPRNYV